VAAAVLETVRAESYRPSTAQELLRAMQIPRDARARVRQAIRELVRDGRLGYVGGRRIVPAGPAGAVRGALARRADGTLAVVPFDGGSAIAVAPRHAGGGSEGDVVAVRPLAGGRERSRGGGIVVEVLERSVRTVLGVIEPAPGGAIVRPFDASEPALRVPAPFLQGAVAGDAVEAAPLRAARGAADAKIVANLGPLERRGVDVEVVRRRYRLRGEFPPAALRAADGLDAAAPEAELRRRERFDQPPPVTIDGENARDFDDAVSVSALPNGGFRVFVHVADVAHFVTPGDPLDLEALARGTSTYFPDRVLPMLPERLSNDLCSLRPHEDRLVHTVIVDLDAAGALRRTRFADGVIRSAARLTYAQVESALASPRSDHGIAPRLLDMLRVADRVRELLERARFGRGSIDFDLPEPVPEFDDRGVLSGFALRPRNRAHRMIEEFMLLANEVVAVSLAESGGPCLFRIHDAPDPLKIENLQSFVRKFGVDWTVDPHAVRPQDIGELLARVEGRPEEPVVTQAALRSMRQARYSTVHEGHFGLASSTYTHFTSPIRRYPDLVVHRLLRQRRRGVVDRPVADGPLEQVAAECSVRERASEAAERELLEWKKVRFLRSRVGSEGDGLVTAVTPFGAFVRLSDALVEGLVHVSRLGGERYEFDEGRQELRGDRGTVIGLGDLLRVRLDRVDVVLRRVDLSLAGTPPVTGSPARRSRPHSAPHGRSAPAKRRG